MELSHILNHLGEDRENYFNAVTPPIIQSANFCFKTVDAMRKGLENEFDAPFYTRGYNPTVAILRQKMAALEGAEDALIFSSGSAAMAAAVISLLKAGDHVICVEKPYSWTGKLLKNILSRYNVTHTFVDGKQFEDFETAIKHNTTLIILETPNSLTFEIQDIEAICNLAKTRGIKTIVDNSFSSPMYQNPLKMGADLVLHSSSKYLNGHSDVVSGVVCGSKELIRMLFSSELMTLGAIISPHDAWLMLRGLRTLKLRVDKSAESAELIVKYLENHPKIEKVLYPFSPSNPQRTLAKKQMLKCGGMFSILIKSDIKGVERFCDALHYFLLACSWGGYESLLFPVCTLHNSINYTNPDLPYNLVRMYIGIEEPQTLIEDLRQALEKV